MSQSDDNRPQSGQQRPPQGRYPKLPVPEDLPRFPEEGERDPFGQNEELLAAASRSGFEIAIELATLAHSRGLCMMLPSPEPGTVDPSLRPWRSFLSCEPDEHDFSSVEIPPPAVTWEAAYGTPVQDLVQRAVLCLAALGASGVPSEMHGRAAELLEHLGYLALGREFHRQKIEMRRPQGMPLQFFYTIGKIAAGMHGHNIIHGDMHTDNFLYDEDQRTAVVSDADTTCFLERPITLQEHASDVGLLKLTCSFEEWETVKLGYREQSPDAAAQVFKLI